MANLLDTVEGPWDTKYINDLPDDAFLLIEKGGTKDEDGFTVPRSLRHLPFKSKNGKIDPSHLRSAISMIPKLKIEGLNEDDKEKLQSKARKLLESLKEEQMETKLSSVLKKIASNSHFSFFFFLPKDGKENQTTNTVNKEDVGDSLVYYVKGWWYNGKKVIQPATIAEEIQHKAFRKPINRQPEYILKALTYPSAEVKDVMYYGGATVVIGIAHEKPGVVAYGEDKTVLNKAVSDALDDIKMDI